ncbi:MAG: 6-pyruvoyl-tetrahydropterin synthase-related protein [Lactobacillus sp.]|nr:6-pyruvoyl-tetrahydropterin synthase-related protein [Lactobacillus sp.]
MKIINQIKKISLKQVALFLIIAIFINFLYFMQGAIIGAHDLPFHYQRVNDLVKNIQHFNFNPAINTYSFNLVGSAVASTYPPLPLYVWAILLLIFQNGVLAYDLFLLATTLVLLVTTYYSFLSVFKDQKNQALVVATAYASCSMVGYYQYISGDLGAVWALGFAPLACAGLYHLFKDNKYQMLSIGMSLMILSHLLNSLILAFSLLIVLIVEFRKIKLNFLISLAKSIGLSLLLTCAFWIKLLIIVLSSKMYTPKSFGILYGINLEGVYNDISALNYRWDITVIAVLGLILSILFFKRLPKLLKICSIVSWIIMFIASAFVPWEYFQNTPLGSLQWTTRLLIFPELIGCLLFTYIVFLLFAKTSKSTKIVTAICMAIILLLNLSLQSEFYNFAKSTPDLTHMWTQKEGFQDKDGRRFYRLSNNDQINNILWYDDAYDYLPLKTLPVFDQIQFPINNSVDFNGQAKFKVNTTAKPDGATMKFNTTEYFDNIELPFIIYNGNYKITLDGQKIAVQKGNHSLLRLNNLNPGSHTVEVTYGGIAWTYLKWVSYIITIWGLILLIKPNLIKSKKED